ncbi:hypothetical protein J3R83DRAFT_8604 [Lanmaoa asiatica]|nr:hypothetical protein J3R83DRAFT_8604 [Lanmaoa asiatica]
MFANKRCLIIPCDRRPVVKLDKGVARELARSHAEKCDKEEEAIAEVLEYIDNMATELARRFQWSRRHYLNKFYIGSKLTHVHKQKTSSWSAFMHFKSTEVNTGKDIGEKDRLAQLSTHATEYHELTDQECQQLIMQFDEEKATNLKPSLTISARTHINEVSNSFNACVMELNMLNHKHGIEGLIVVIRGSHNIKMDPQIHMTSEVVSHFLRTTTSSDPMVFRMKMEQLPFFGDITMSYRKRVAKAKNTISIRLQNDLAELTQDVNARVDYVWYECSVVQCYNVRLVGYTHDQWANPSDLKGGVDALKKLAKAVLEKKCYFVTISANEVTQCQERITNGEILTPNVDRTVPVTHNPKPTLPSASISVPSPQLTLPSALSAPSTAPQNNLPQPARQNQATGLDTSNSTTATGHTDTMGNRHLDENVTLDTILIPPQQFQPVRLMATRTGKSALLLGGTGAVGKHLLAELLASEEWTRVGEYGRRVSATPGRGPPAKLEQKVINFEDLDKAELKAGRWDVVFVTLGTTRAKAGGAAQFEKIDREYVVRACEAAKTDDPTHEQRVVYLSSGGANPTSPFLYMKQGLTELGVARLGYKDAIVFRPGYLQGAERPEKRTIESVLGYVTRFPLDHFVSHLAKSMAKAGALGSSHIPTDVGTTKVDAGQDTWFTLLSNKAAMLLGGK